MGDASDLIRVAVLAAGAAVLFLKHRQIAEAIQEFKNNFPRGGPPAPMHPSPAGDDALLRRGSPKSDSD